MSNHSGSYMLNEVLTTLFDLHIDEKIGKETTIEFAKRLIALGDAYDCNTGEILEGLDDRIGICYFCRKEADNLQNGLCSSCR